MAVGQLSIRFAAEFSTGTEYTSFWIQALWILLDIISAFYNQEFPNLQNLCLKKFLVKIVQEGV